ncbi:MAG: molecular chaperone TorD family protein [Pseudomonadota bacterium]
MAKHAHDLRNACSHFFKQSEINSIDWTEFEYAYNHLFVGPMAVQAPPYASVYLEPEEQLMGRVSLEMRNLYDELSLAVPPMGEGGVVPDDHISMELDALLALVAVQDWCRGFEGSHAVKDECHMYLSHLTTHMSMWVPQFIDKACQNNTYYDANRSMYYLIENIMGILLLNIHSLSKHKYGSSIHCTIIKECYNGY